MPSRVTPACSRPSRSSTVARRRWLSAAVKYRYSESLARTSGDTAIPSRPPSPPGSAMVAELGLRAVGADPGDGRVVADFVTTASPSGRKPNRPTACSASIATVPATVPAIRASHANRPGRRRADGPAGTDAAGVPAEERDREEAAVRAVGPSTRSSRCRRRAPAQVPPAARSAGGDGRASSGRGGEPSPDPVCGPRLARRPCDPGRPGPPEDPEEPSTTAPDTAPPIQTDTPPPPSRPSASTSRPSSRPWRPRTPTAAIAGRGRCGLVLAPGLAVVHRRGCSGGRALPLNTTPTEP